ncbi:MAG: NADH:flavin oxidoreductase/NADH oxidase [Hyphomicrobiaceae bacterium]
MKAFPKLLSPLSLRSITPRNRLVVSPMCQYSAGLGLANDWHFAHLSRFALGGFGTVMVEATAVTPEGRITHGDLGLWNDAQIVPLAHIAAFLKTHGAVPAIQIAHAGRKASAQRPWEGDSAMTEKDLTERAEAPWKVYAPSSIPHNDGWLMPEALDQAGIDRIRDAFVATARRADTAGFEIVEVHCAHGYLMNEFLSPIANKRTDSYGGTLENRMRFPLETIEAVRAVWPQHKPLFVRISAIDGVEGGWTLDDSIVFATALAKIGVDVVDTSSGGVGRSYSGKPGPMHQVPFAQAIREKADIKTMAVGLITKPSEAASIVDEDRADLVALGREALANPQWPLHAAAELTNNPLDYSAWPVQAGHWLRARAASMVRHKSS